MMRTASEKLAIIRLVEDSELSVRRTLDEIKVSRTSFYRWYAAYEKGGLDGLSNQGRVSRRLWNRIPDAVRSLVVEVALDRPELTPRELAWHITDTHDYFVSESSVYRILKTHDLITSPQFTVMQAADKFQHPTSRVHELWQTDFTYFHEEFHENGQLKFRGRRLKPATKFGEGKSSEKFIEVLSTQEFWAHSEQKFFQ